MNPVRTHMHTIFYNPIKKKTSNTNVFMRHKKYHEILSRFDLCNEK